MNISALISGTTYYSNVSTGIITTPWLLNDSLLKNITVMAPNYQNNTYTNWNLSSNLAASLNSTIFTLNITARNGYDNTSVRNFSASISGVQYNTTNGTLTIPNLLKSMTYDVYVFDQNSFNTTYLAQTTTNLTLQINALLNYTYITFSFTDAVSGAIIQPVNMTDRVLNYSWLSTNGLINISPSGSRNYSFTSTGYASINQSFNFSAREVSTKSIVMSPYINFTILEEKTTNPFNVSGTTSTKILVYCPTMTQEISFNITANRYSSYTPVNCSWNFIKLDISYASASYYRTLIPALTERNITFYAIDLNKDLAVQIILRLNDLTGDFKEGTATLTKSISGQEKTIVSQSWDIEQKVVAYLIKDGLYTVSLKSNDGETRTLGYLIADAAGEKTITVPEINLVPESHLWRDVIWDWQQTDTTLKLVYNDSTGYGSNVVFIVYNESSNAQIYNYTLSNTSLNTFSYTSTNTTGYTACFIANNSQIGGIYACHVFSPSAEQVMGNWSAWQGEEEEKQVGDFRFWIATFIVVAIVIVGASVGSVGGGAVLASIFLWMFIKWKWWDLGSSKLNYAILGIIAVIAVITLILEAERR